MDFGDVIKEMKAHPEKKYARKGWNGKGIYIGLQNPDEHSANTLPYIYMVTDKLVSDNPDAPRGRVPWLASQTDMLCDDWVEVASTPFGLNMIDSSICSNTAREFREYKYDNQPNPNRSDNIGPVAPSPSLKLTAVGYNCGTYEDFKNMNQPSNVKKKMREEIQSDKDLTDLVHNPAHYTAGRKYEPWDVALDWDLDCPMSLALRYIARAGRKQYAGMTMRQSEETDIMKAIECLKKELSVVREKD